MRSKKNHGGLLSSRRSSDRKRSRPNPAFSATMPDDQCPRRMLAEDPGRTQPRAAYPRRCPTGVRGLTQDNSLPAHLAPLVVWSDMMRTIGAISDTHGLLRPQAVAALAGCDPIIHAGDVGSPDVLARLGALAPVHAVRGNVDHGAWSANLPVTQRIEIDGFRIYVLHILAELDLQAADNVDAVIYGHSHQPKIETKNGTLFFNPGSAGPRRFRLPITVGRMTAEHGKLRAEIVELSVER
jgi:putative phosphoesterase